MSDPQARTDQAERHLPGDLAVWLIILLELATFALLFATYAVVYLQF